MWSYLLKNLVAETFHILAGSLCRQWRMPRARLPRLLCVRHLIAGEWSIRTARRVQLLLLKALRGASPKRSTLAPSYPVHFDILASSLDLVVEFSVIGNDEFDPPSSSAYFILICRIPAWRPITTGRSSPKQEQRLKQGVSKKPLRKCATPCPATPEAAAATPRTAFVTADPTSSYAKRMAYTGRIHLQTYKACKAKYADRREYSILT